MRLALWCGSYFKGFGGAEKVVNDLLNRFANLGMDQFLIANNSDHRQKDNLAARVSPTQVAVSGIY